MNQTDYFTEKIATLPEDLQEAIRASNHEGVFKDLQKEYKLHIDQAQILETLATQLIFGDIDAPQFVNNMFSEAHVSSAVAGDILLKIDTRILRKIRTHLEGLAEAKKKDEELAQLLMDDEEAEEAEKAEIYAAYYADMANILQETEEQMLKEGILPDGSNITDEMLAKAMGITIEELHKRSQPGAFQEANLKTVEPTQNYNISNEKEELLHELESPEKSFSKPLFTPVAPVVKPVPTVEKVVEKKIDVVTLPDHQLQNTHIEKPYKDEILETASEKQVETAVVKPQQKEQKEFVVKKPVKLTLSNDPYKEPIE